MATLTGQIKLDISGVTSDPISVDVSMTKACLSGGITSRSINTTATSGEKVVEKDEYSLGDMIYLRNRQAKGATEIITIRLGAATAGEIRLEGGQFAIFPWVKGEDILAYTNSGAPILEIGTFASA